MENSTVNYKRFNRHEIFTTEDRDLVFDLIDEVPLSQSNMLYGLFDGYWYNALMTQLKSKTTVSGDLLIKLESLLEKIDNHINK